MFKGLTAAFFALILILVLGFGVEGCNWNWPGQAPATTEKEQQQQREERTRDEVARATEQLKPALESAGRQLGEATERAAEEARAAAQGVKEGWEHGAQGTVDLNSASETELTGLPGITAVQARRIIRNRPYRDKQDLVTKGVLSESSYSKIRDDVSVK